MASGSGGSGAGTPGKRRRARVRNRLLVSVVLCAVAVIAAGAPHVMSASQEAADTQELVDRARLDQQAIALSHSLADERDGMVEYVAAGRTSREGTAGVSESLRARVDRQVKELRSSSAPASVPGGVVKELKRLPKTRQSALGGKGSSLETYDGYTRIIRALRGLTRDVAEGLPARAQDPTASALPSLARAVDQASATRGLLRAALAADGPQRALMGRAEQSRVREQAALEDFDETAGAAARNSWSTTVNGTDVTVAERYLDRLTARSALTPSARMFDQDRFDTSVSARVAHMRGVQASFAAAEVKRLEKVRDDDVTGLQIGVGLLVACVLLAVGAGVQTARSMARPLSVLKRGSQRLAKDPAGEEPITFRGRNDEFADVVGALNALRETAAELGRRAACAERDQDELAVEKAQLTERHLVLGEEYTALREELEEAREQLESGGGAAQGAFVHLAMRTLGLVERQLGVIEELEEKEADPDRLGTLFTLDHLATRMRRHSENLLLLAGAEQGGTGLHQAPAPLLDVLRAAISEIERYERVELGTLPPHTRIVGFAADDVSHLLAELLDNAASFSAPDSPVRLSAWMLENGEVMLSVQDDGIGIAKQRLADLNCRLGEPDVQRPPFGSGAADGAPGEPDGLGMGLYVVARLAARHGLRVQLRKQKQGGTAAVVIVPRALLPDHPAPSASASASDTDGASEPGGPEHPGSTTEPNSPGASASGTSDGPGASDRPDGTAGLTEAAQRLSKATASAGTSGALSGVAEVGQADVGAPAPEGSAAVGDGGTAEDAGAAEIEAEVALEGGAFAEGGSVGAVSGPVAEPGIEPGVEPGDEPADLPGVGADAGMFGAPSTSAAAAGDIEGDAAGQSGAGTHVLGIPGAGAGSSVGQVPEPDAPELQHPKAADHEPVGEHDRALDQAPGSLARAEAEAEASPASVSPASASPASGVQEASGEHDAPGEDGAGGRTPTSTADSPRADTGPAAGTGASTDAGSGPSRDGSGPAGGRAFVDAQADAGTRTTAEAQATVEAQAAPDAEAQPGAAARTAGASQRAAAARRTAEDRPTAEDRIGAEDRNGAQDRSGAGTRTIAEGRAVRDESVGNAAYTAKGLPKRTPRIAAQRPAEERPRVGGTDAEELRRRLGGFQQGTRRGLRDAAAQVAAEEAGRADEGDNERAGAQVDGGTAEEARK
ncbi:nitrate- and nitrite sensing domain-containing protein [Streptomyces cacaoi]